MLVRVVAVTVVGLFAADAAAAPKKKPAKVVKDPPLVEPRPAPTPKVRPPSAARPAPEVAELGKLVIGTWKCTGTAAGVDGASDDVTAIIRIKLDVERVWLREELEAKTATLTWRTERVAGYDATTHKWRRLSFGSDAGYAVATSDGVRDHVLDWDGNGEGPGGAALVREHVDLGDLKAGLKRTEERSADQGKTWAPTLALSCAR